MLSVRYDRVRLHAVACRLPTSSRRCPKRRGSSSFVVPLADGATVCRSSSHVVARESSEERRLHAVCTQAGETLAWEV